MEPWYYLKMKKILLSSIITSFIILTLVINPHVSQASWWNPGTWFNNWSFSSVKVEKVDSNIKISGASNDDITSCDSRTNSDEKNHCYATLARDNANPSLCLKITATSTLDLCYVGVAGVKKDISVCSNIKNNDTRNICFGAVAVAKQDKSLCDLIIERPAPYGGYKDLCYQKTSKNINTAPVGLNNSSEPSLTILYPNGGESVKSGTNVSIRWNASSLVKKERVYVSITDYSENGFGTKTINSGETLASQGQYNWFVPSDYKVGSKYKISVYTNLQKYIDSSDNYFTITAPVLNQQASITVTSPNGGETFAAGQPFTVTWFGSNFPSNGRVTVALQDSRTINTYLAEGLSNSGSATLTIPSSTQAGAYTVRVFCGLQGSDAYCNSSPKSEDYSNASFNITSTQGSPTPSPTPVSGAPVITSIVGPSGFWANNSAGMWTIYVSDSNVGSITASVDWGDGSPITNGGNMGDGSVRFAHQYTQSGTYTLTFTVRNQNGLTGQKTTTIQVR